MSLPHGQMISESHPREEVVRRQVIPGLLCTLFRGAGVPRDGRGGHGGLQLGLRSLAGGRLDGLLLLRCCAPVLRTPNIFF